MSSAITLKEVAEKIDATCLGDAGLKITGIASLQHATRHDISFLSSQKFTQHLSKTRALAVILKPEDSELYAGNKLLVADPYLAFARLANYFQSQIPKESGINSTAVVDASAQVAEDAWIGHKAVIAPGAKLESGVYIGAGSYIGQNCNIGSGTKILPNVTILDETVIGNDCIIHSGAVIGDDGFGLAKDGEKWLKIPQTGKVVIGDEVEVGSNTTIDCGALEDTVIENGVKLDNQIQVAHNVHIGENTAIAGATVIAGSVDIGRNCSIAGMVGIVGHLSVCDNVYITGQSLITKSITEPGAYSSSWSARKDRVWKKMVAGLNRLDILKQKVRKLEQKINEE